MARRKLDAVSLYNEARRPHYHATGAYLVARWESSRGAHAVELWKADGSGWSYRAHNAGGYLGNDFPSDDAALAAFAPRVNDFQPDTNRRPMRRTR